ncbi:peptidoglycan DD-metalloendopeptidase family protein [Mucilaginibacter sp.]
MDATSRLATALKAHPQSLSNVVDFDVKSDRLYQFDLTKNNSELSFDVVNDVAKFSHWVDQKLVDNHCRYGIGGYMELRTIYDNRVQFDNKGEQRQLHLGVDIWADAGTPVYAPLDGIVHSFQDNANFGDYGPTIILQHQIGDLTLYSLYGHLNRECLFGLTVGKSIKSGVHIANFGIAEVNGGWPPHLHFQLMLDMEGWIGDYPGACKKADKEIYLKNIPDPALLLRLASPIN